MTVLHLPFPPSANGLFKNAGKRRVKTDHYKAWIEEAGWEVQRQRPAKVTGRYRLTIVADAPDNRARDIDNLIKAVSDLLKRQGVIEEDSKARGVTAEWSDVAPARGAGVRVLVEPAT